jgi:hypothetical protein
MKSCILLLILFFGFSSVCAASDISILEWRLCYQIDDRECSFPVTDGLVVNDEIKKIFFWVKVKSPRDGFIRHVYSFYGKGAKSASSSWSEEERELHVSEEAIDTDEFLNATWSAKKIGESLHCGKWTVDVTDENGEKLIPTVGFDVVSKR